MIRLIYILDAKRCVDDGRRKVDRAMKERPPPTTSWLILPVVKWPSTNASPTASIRSSPGLR